MVAVTLAVAAVAIVVLYETNLESQRQGLRDAVANRAALVATISEQRHSLSLLMEDINELKLTAPSMATTGEFVLGRRSGDRIEFLSVQRHQGVMVPEPVAFFGKLAEPMRRALAGESGTMEDLDYLGRQVMAAYQPVHGTDMGIVAKMDMSEVRAPLWRAAPITLLTTLLLVILGALIFIRLTAPINAQIEKSERRFHQLYDRVPLPLCYIDRSGNFNIINQRFEEVFGFSQNEVPELDKWSWLPYPNPGEEPTDIKKWGESLCKVEGAKADIKSAAFRILCKDGKERIMLVGGIVLETGFLYTFTDLTDRVEIEEALQESNRSLSRSNQELQQFAYVASHDLQEPLRMVASYTELLAKRYGGQLDQRADKYINYAVDGAKRMQGLINDLLAFSRVGTKGQELEPTDSNQVIQSVLHNLDKAIQESGARIIVDDLPSVMADRSQLSQVWQNLIGNAIKFCGDEPPIVEISVWPQGGMLAFCVSDNGIGIEPEFQERIFAVFQRLHERGKYPGSGIGLSIVKKIVERHGGQIYVESSPGQGSRFTFTLRAA